MSARIYALQIIPVIGSARGLERKHARINLALSDYKTHEEAAVQFSRDADTCHEKAIVATFCFSWYRGVHELNIDGKYHTDSYTIIRNHVDIDQLGEAVAYLEVKAGALPGCIVDTSEETD